MARPEFTGKKTPMRLLSREEVSDLLGVTYVTIWMWTRDGKFPLGRSIGAGERIVTWPGSRMRWRTVRSAPSASRRAKKTEAA
jgi:predicted DNA-binding transcriptional regulator AlpA